MRQGKEIHMATIHLEVPDEVVEFLYDDETGDIRFRPMMTDNPTHVGHATANATRRFYGDEWDPVPEYLRERATEHLRTAGILK